MRIRDLELIVAVYESGNLTLAARQVGMSEPGLSKQLQVIERRSRLRFFDRGRGGAALTEAGRAFVEHARVSIQEYHRALHEARETQQAERHTLRIGTSAFLPPSLIELLRPIELRLYRNFSIEVVAEYCFDLLLQLQRHQIDLALVTSPPDTAAITSVRIATSSFMLVFRKGHPLAAKLSATLNDVASYPWIFFNRNVHPPLYDLILHRTQAGGHEPRILHYIGHEDYAAPVLTDDSLVAWLTPTAAERVTGTGLTCVPLLDSEIRLETHIATLASNNSLLVSEFVRSFVKRFESKRIGAQLSLPNIGGDNNR
ncbi:MAG TPA: LysR family transcriptional regulator [Acidobacteriaceae bacterium]|jgi:DNA-binding transcriptional LysR family regulator